MKTVFDVRQLLKKFGTFIYIGNRLADLELMEDEIKELYQNACISAQEYQLSVLILKQEARKIREEKGADE
ncbi:cytosolic protein [Virgibacillus phasianinus]|uniref:Cytosolic protein n=1 Tax=Virgibacillus phasianinus TaxID=2017483 RepID=A0A220U5L4_9BACI|nr:YqgQ family protein [Virgibacillus phasianinus]ASK63196.1 cytosolic protein [Virgibacillus phasianinus]